MHEKKKRMIEVGMRLFANKGFHATSIQEIADLSDVSKGAFYLHFNSKDDLILSIYQYYYEMMKEKLGEVEAEEHLTPREKLAKQVKVHFEEFLMRKEFVVMHLRENFSLNEEIDAFISKMRTEQQAWLEGSLRSIYGDSIETSIKDGAVILEGLISAYLKTLIFENVTYQFDELAQFLVRRLDDLMNGLGKEEAPGPLTVKYMESDFQSERFHPYKRKEAKDIFTDMKRKIRELDLSEAKKDELLTSVHLMVDELEKEVPQKVVFQGMLANLKGIKELEHSREKVSKLFELQLL
ncbi:TetR/AcrR family transcriptional regulator [Bacillus tianshenii]|nr:TetR/AcrR family transcriptional regulator [Bacillus tianshenii]